MKTQGSSLTESWFVRHRLVAFFCLAFLLSWYPWFIALARGTTTGPNPLGPFVAALIATAIVTGKAGLREFLARLVRVRVGWRYYGFIFGLPVLICLAALGIALALTGSSLPALQIDKLRELPERFIFILLFIGLGEEPGWRGFALPELQKRYTPLRASLILAPVWAFWHLPLIGHEFPLHIVPAFLLSLLGGTLVQTWLFNRTRGSIFVQMVFHAAVNTVGAGLIYPHLSGSALIMIWYAAGFLWLGIGAALMLTSAKRTSPAGLPSAFVPSSVAPR